MSQEYYYSLNRFYRDRYGQKVYKLAVDGGFTCPNRDGHLGYRGCIFCNQSGSGDYAVPLSVDSDPKVSLLEAKKQISLKTDACKFIVYFQAFTNTYAPVNILRQLYESVLVDDSIVGIAIATRGDCLSPDIIDLLKDLNRRTDIYIELGLQSIHPATARFIRRGYPLSIYDQAVQSLNNAGIPVITHLILGLPGETHEDILESVRYITANHKISGIKLQLLHLMKDTDLYTYYKQKPFSLLSKEAYIDLLIDCIEIIPDDIVIHRMTGDGSKDLLIGPLWSLNKRDVLNRIHRRFKERNTYQGIRLD